MKLNGKISEKGYTLMPLQVYFKGSLVKVGDRTGKRKEATIRERILPKRISAEVEKIQGEESVLI